MRFDLHVHTSFSDCSDLTIEQIINNAQGHGLDGVCITDHDTMSARSELEEGIQANGLVAIFGMEYEAREGHFLLFGIGNDLPPGLTAIDMLRKVEERGGVTIAAHPFRRGMSVDTSVLRDDLCNIVETINGRNARHENLSARELCRKRNLIACGGSDAHELDELGRVVTVFDNPIGGVADFIRELKKGACYPEVDASSRSLVTR